MTAASALAIREAALSDAGAMGRVHVACWRETYAGLLPATALATLSASDRAAMWERILTSPELPTKVFVCEADREIMALAACGVQRDAALSDKGFGSEVSAIYVLKSQQRRGIGKALMRTMASSLTGLGCAGMSLWVLRDNVGARRFYEKLGGRVVSEKEESRPYGTVVEVTYGWPDLRHLSDQGAPRTNVN